MGEGDAATAGTAAGAAADATADDATDATADDATDATADDAADDAADATPRSKRARSELSTSRLLKAAGELITEVGFERATLAAIGERAGYSHGLVTRRFGSKEGLLWALVERMTVQYGADTLRPAIGDRVGVDALMVIADGIRNAIARRPDQMRVLYVLMFEALMPLPALRERMVDYHEGFRGNIERHVRRGIDEGVVRADVAPALAAALFVGAIRGATYQWLLDPDFDVDGALQSLGGYLDLTLRAGPAPAPAGGPAA